MSLFFFYGTMNSGKTTRLLQEAYNIKQRGFDLIMIQSGINDRDNGIESRIGISSEHDIVFYEDTDIVKEIKKNRKANKDKKIVEVLIDEAQFLSKKQVDELFVYSVKKELPILCYGLKTDFKGTAFPGSKRLLELAELEQLDTVPCRCGNKARFNARFNSNTGKLLSRGPEVLTEGSNDNYIYDPLCPKCFIALGGKFESN